jgi:hypothetical protein
MTNKILTEDKVEQKEEKKSQRQLEIERIRKTRVAPGKASLNLDFPAREGYKRRVVCDRQGRLDRFVKAGWAYVTTDQLGEPHTGSLKATTREGIDSRVSQVVGSHKDGRPMTGYLMELPEDIYDEDQVAKMEKVDTLESGLKQGMSADGSTRPGQDGMRIGSAGIKIEQKGRQR